MLRLIAILMLLTCARVEFTASEPKAFHIEGTHIEACSCTSSCAFEISGEDTRCNAVAAMQIDQGNYDGADISGTRIAVAAAKDSVHLFLDCPDASKSATLEKFARAVFAGNVKSVEKAKINIDGRHGKYTVTVNDGKSIAFATEPVFGGDHKTPVKIENTQSPLNPTLWQGHCVSAKFNGGEDSFEIPRGRNSFFNPQMKSDGKI